MNEARKCRECGAVLDEETTAAVCELCANEPGIETEKGIKHQISRAMKQEVPENLSKNNKVNSVASEQPDSLIFQATGFMGKRQILPGTKMDDYEILEHLGGGGMGDVYKARQLSLNRIVAIKFIKPEHSEDSDFVRLFRREAELAAKVKHSSIVRVYAIKEIECIPFIVMEYVAGETLWKRIQRIGHLGFAESLSICIAVAEGLKCLWEEKNIIHRDIKPNNIFLTEDGGVRIGDFGLAKFVGRATYTFTVTSKGMGTPGFISREQALGEKNIDHRADIYSLGCTLYTMLAGEPPYKGMATQLAVHRHTKGPAPRIADAVPNCPNQIIQLVNKMCATYRHNRHREYNELISEMIRVRASFLPVPVTAPSETPPEKELPPPPVEERLSGNRVRVRRGKRIKGAIDGRPKTWIHMMVERAFVYSLPLKPDQPLILALSAIILCLAWLPIIVCFLFSVIEPSECEKQEVPLSYICYCWGVPLTLIACVLWLVHQRRKTPQHVETPPDRASPLTVVAEATAQSSSGALTLPPRPDIASMPVSQPIAASLPPAFFYTAFAIAACMAFFGVSLFFSHNSPPLPEAGISKPALPSQTASASQNSPIQTTMPASHVSMPRKHESATLPALTVEHGGKFAVVTTDRVPVYPPKPDGTIGLSQLPFVLNKGDQVELVEPVMENFAKIRVPVAERVWVHSSALDNARKEVVIPDTPLRTGPSESYEIVGTVKKGELVQAEQSQYEWVKIRPPSNCFAYVHSRFLQTNPVSTPKSEGPKTDASPRSSYQGVTPEELLERVIDERRQLQSKGRFLQDEDGRERPLPEHLEARVIYHDKKWHLVVLDVGKKKGVVQNGVFLITRGDQEVGHARVAKVEDDCCIADCMGDFKTKPPMPGDHATPKRRVTGMATVTEDRVNVRAAAEAASEVLLQFNQGDQVELAEPLPAPTTAETVVFAKIHMPSAARVWVHKNMLDAAGTTVIKTDGHLRAGPGTSYSVVGKINKGDVIQPEQTQDDWVKIKPTTNCWAFVRVKYLQNRNNGSGLTTASAYTKKGTNTVIYGGTLVCRPQYTVIMDPPVEWPSSKPWTETITVKTGRCNVYAEPSAKSAVLFGLHRGETVEVERGGEAGTLASKGEHNYFQEIRMPAQARVWMNKKCLDDSGTKVIEDRAGVYATPTEDSSVVGFIKKDSLVQSVLTKGEWVQIKPSAECHAFVLEMSLAPNVREKATKPVISLPVAVAVTQSVSHVITATSATKERPFINSLGMRFVPVAGTQVLFSVWDTRVQDYEKAFSKRFGSKNFKQGPTHPVVNVSWYDAKDFCQWLTDKELSEGRLKPGQEYRLPTDVEWNKAVGLANKTSSAAGDAEINRCNLYPWGNQWPPPRGAGNYAPELKVDDFPKTSPVGSFAANQFGLYDMGGNVWQWCENFYDNLNGGCSYSLRGASWFECERDDLLSSTSKVKHPGSADNDQGFRVVLLVASPPPIGIPSAPAAPAPVPTPLVATVENLINDLKSRDERLQGAAVSSLVNLGKPAVEPLIACLRNQEWYVRRNAAGVLGKLGKFAVEPLIVCLKDRDSNMRQRAVETLGELGDARAVEPLIARLKDQEPNVRGVAAEALGKLGDARAVAPLVICLKDQEWYVQGLAAKSLGELGDARAIEPLITSLKDAEYLSLAPLNDVVAALSKLGKAAVEPLIACLKDQDPDVRRRAVETLGELGDTRAVKPLIARLSDQDSSVRKNAADMLDKFSYSPLNTNEKIAYLIALGSWDDLVELGKQAVTPLVGALPNWDEKWRIGAALEKLGWKPASDTERVYQWICDWANKSENLKTHWQLTKRVLLADVKSGNRRRIVNALKTFENLDTPEIIPELVRILEGKGNKEMAKAFLISDHPDFTKAANSWAKRHGYKFREEAGTLASK